MAVRSASGTAGINQYSVISKAVINEAEFNRDLSPSTDLSTEDRIILPQ
jgi:hypothetical protein